MTSGRKELSPKETKILWGIGTVCAHPNCNQWLIEEESDASPAAVVGEGAHIVGNSPHGPRGDASYPKEKLDSADNRILLCPTHHTIVDKQPEQYPIELLRSWKEVQEKQTRVLLGIEVQGVDFQELSRVVDALIATPGASATTTLQPTKPVEKMRKNDLSSETAELLNIGYLRSSDVEEFIARTEALEPGFANRLVAGFRAEYDRLRAEGLEGDDLFAALANWAGQSAGEPRRAAAGIAVLTHLFTICDVFEP